MKKTHTAKPSPYPITDSVKSAIKAISPTETESVKSSTLYAKVTTYQTETVSIAIKATALPMENVSKTLLSKIPTNNQTKILIAENTKMDSAKNVLQVISSLKIQLQEFVSN